MDKPLLGTDYPPGPDRGPLYQKLALEYWKRRIAEQKWKGYQLKGDACDETPEIVSDS